MNTPQYIIGNNLLNILKTLAKKHIVTDDPESSISDYSGYNDDDAYYMGCNDGEVLLARQILKQIGVNYE